MCFRSSRPNACTCACSVAPIECALRHVPATRLSARQRENLHALTCARQGAAGGGGRLQRLGCSFGPGGPYSRRRADRLPEEGACHSVRREAGNAADHVGALLCQLFCGGHVLNPRVPESWCPESEQSVPGARLVVISWGIRWRCHVSAPSRLGVEFSASDWRPHA